jgi:hypothetical protein
MHIISIDEQPYIGYDSIFVVEMFSRPAKAPLSLPSDFSFGE